MVTEDGRCAIVETVQDGPHRCDEGDGPVLPVTAPVARHLVGRGAVTAADGVQFRAARIAPSNLPGPCDADLVDRTLFLRGFIGGPCDSNGDCPYAGGCDR